MRAWYDGYEVERVPINADRFQNDMTTFASADDLLTLLVHLGYLTYSSAGRCVWVPNHEVAQEFVTCIEAGGWDEVASVIAASEGLLQAVLAEDARKTAQLVAKTHAEVPLLDHR